MIWAGVDLRRPVVLWDPEAAAVPGVPEDSPPSWYQARGAGMTVPGLERGIGHPGGYDWRDENRGSERPPQLEGR